MSAENPNRQKITPEIRGIIAKMDTIMNAPEFNHAGTPIQVAIDLWNEGKIDSFAQFETFLRIMDSRNYFIAAPLTYFGKQFETVYPVKGHKDQPKYSLYTVVNGSAEAQQLRTKLGINQIENWKRLKKTGILIPKQ